MLEHIMPCLEYRKHSIQSMERAKRLKSDIHGQPLNWDSYSILPAAEVGMHEHLAYGWPMGNEDRPTVVAKLIRDLVFVMLI
jgi:hypothetical protein